MKKSFMTRALATGLSLAMAFSLSAATNVTTAEAATSKMKVTSKTVTEGKTVKAYMTSSAAKKYRIKSHKESTVAKKYISVAMMSSRKGLKITAKEGALAAANLEKKGVNVKINFVKASSAKAAKKATKVVDKVNLKVVVKAKPVEKLTMTAEATGVKKIAVNFNKAVDTTTTKIVVKKGADTPTVASTTFAADAKSVEIVMGTKLTAGTYTVEATVGTDTLTADIVAQDEKLTSFELVSPNLVADAKVTTKASISYKAVNQYGEMMAANSPKVTCTFGETEQHGTPSADKSANAIIKNINEALAIPGTTGTIVIVDESTGVNLNTTVTYQSKAIPSSATVYGVYSLKTEKLVDGNLTTGAKGEDYALLINVKDQYDNDMTPGNILYSEVEVTYNAAPILTDLRVDSAKVAGNEKEVTYEGASAFLIPLTSVTGDTKNIDTAGSLSLTIVSSNKGVIAQPVITVDESKIIKTLSITPASTVYAQEDNKMVIEAYDANGDAITKYDDLKAAGLEVTSTSENALNEKLALKKNADGTATLYFNPKACGTDAKNYKESTIATLVMKANSATSSDYMVKTVNVTYYEKRIPWSVSGITDKTITACASGSTLNFDLSTLMYEDQYGNSFKSDDAVVKPATNQVMIFVGKNDAFMWGNQLIGPGSGDYKKNVLPLKSIRKGDATLYIKYIKPNTLDDYDVCNDSKYDIKVPISVTLVNDTVASDLKLVVNKGNAVYVTDNAVKIAKFNTATTDVTNHGADGNDKVYVYVTGVVNGKTVVLPSSQYTIITDEFGKLGAFDAKENDKTETKTVTVVVDSESGAQTLTADVTISNNDPKAVTIEGDAGEITGTAGVALTAADLYKAVKFKDQYGNAFDANDTKYAEYVYKVEMTGVVNSDNFTIAHPSTQAIEVTFKTADTYNADVTVTSKDGKLTCTKSVKFVIS